MTNSVISPSEAASHLLLRQQARSDFRSWCVLVGWQPALHHELIIKKCQEVSDSKTPRYLIMLMPPGVAKSTYTSKTFISWYLGRNIGHSILACSYSKDLAVTFGRTARNYVETYANVLGYSLSSDSRAADEWETTTNGRYFCAGVGAGIAGHRADLGLIDDYLGSQEDADSKTVREKQWNWFLGDFWPRVSGTKGSNDGSVIIIANRRHEDDLVGRLLRIENNDAPIPPEKWEVVKLPFFAEENDPLGRKVGEVIWPEKFGQKAEQVKRLPGRIRAGLYQQSPRADDGGYFRQKWMTGYLPQDLPDLSDMRIYAASDHACSDKDESPGANATVLLFGGWDGEKLWILPQCWWEKENTSVVVDAMLRFGRLQKPLTWWAEKGHISKSIGPFLKQRMRSERNYLHIEEIVPVKDKTVRARSAQGMCEFGQVMFPKFTPWWNDAEDELMTFPGGKSDDFVDAFAHLCAGVHRMITPGVKEVDVKEEDYLDKLMQPLTLGSLSKVKRMTEKQREYALLDK